MTTPMTAPRWNYDLDLSAPLRWKKPRDLVEVPGLFDAYRSNDDIAAVFGVMAATPQHTYHVTSRRARSMARWFEWVQSRLFSPVTFCGDTAHITLGGDGIYKPLNGEVRGALRCQWPLRNVFLGIYAENQEHAGEEIPHIIRCPAVVRVVNLMPLVGPVDLKRIDATRAGWRSANGSPAPTEVSAFKQWQEYPTRALLKDGIDWVRIGGDVGSRAKPCELGWIRRIINQCTEAGVPVSVERIGSKPYSREDRISHNGNTTFPLVDGFWRFLNSRNGSDPSEWPEDLRVQERPVVTP